MLQWLRAKLDRFLARIRRYLTLGSGYCPADPTVNPLIGTADLGIPRTICNYTETRCNVKPLSKHFLRDFLRVWKRGKSSKFRCFLLFLVALQLRGLGFFFLGHRLSMAEPRQPS